MSEFFNGFIVWCCHHPIFIFTAILGVFLTTILLSIIDRSKKPDNTKPVFVYFNRK